MNQFYHHILRITVAVVALLASITSSNELYAINAAPTLSDFPTHLLSMPEEVLLRKAVEYVNSQSPDSALLCYMIVAQRDFDTTSQESIKRGLTARLNAGDLYYHPFYDFGRAYSLFQDTYRLASEHDRYDFMGIAANSIGNVLSIYNGTDYSREREEEIIDWYTKSMEFLIKSDKPEMAVSVEYYDFTGTRVSNPSNGIFLRKSVFDDGTSKVNKVVVRK